MTAFWKNLHLLAQGQLFNGGYLVDKAVEPLATTAADANKTGGKPASKFKRAPLPTRTAAFR
jgi:hypothetical protein